MLPLCTKPSKERFPTQPQSSSHDLHHLHPAPPGTSLPASLLLYPSHTASQLQRPLLVPKHSRHVPVMQPCTCYAFCLEMLPPDIHIAHILTFSRILLKCHLILYHFLYR